MNPIQLFMISTLLLVLGAIVTWIIGNRRELTSKLSTVFFALSSIGVLSVVFNVFSSGTAQLDAPLIKVPGIDAGLLLRIDFLSALFLGIIALVGFLVALYAVRYMNLKIFADLSLRAFFPVLMFFFASVMYVVVVVDMFFFFIFWEIMTLASYFLVIFNKRDKDTLRAGFKYFLITHIATALMFIAVIMIYLQGGSFSFDALGQAMQSMSVSNPGLLHLALLFLFLAFATKAGILPMGDWLPDAYSSAPTPATVAFAGSMTKLGVYGVIRIFVDILPVSDFSQTWGIIIALMGTISIFIGTLTALVQEESKRLLSFHVIGQMGYIFLGVGMGIYFLNVQPVLAIVALSAGIFHLINNVCYKSCLFFNAGSVVWKTGTTNLNLVGGLYRVLPMTAIITVIASLSISGVPPLSGFSSKWLIYQSSIRAAATNPLILGFGIVALFISIVTLASFIKFSSTLFYGKYADNNAKAKRREVPLTMMIPQVVMALLSIILGILPILPLKYIHKSVASLMGADFFPPMQSIYGTDALGGLMTDYGKGAFAVWNPLLLTLVGLFCILIAYAFYRSGSAPRRADTTWYCGEEHGDEEVRYRAHSFYLPFKKMFRIRIGKYEREGVYPSIGYPKITFGNNLFKRITDIDKWFYNPLVNHFMVLMKRFSSTHSGVPHLYLLWLIVGTIMAVVVLFLLAGHQGHL
jgi:hydrogenase-4 component B